MLRAVVSPFAGRRGAVHRGAQVGDVGTDLAEQFQGWLVSPACPIDELLVFGHDWSQRPLALMEEIRALGVA